MALNDYLDHNATFYHDSLDANNSSTGLKIRVLAIQPDTWLDPIWCELSTVRLRDDSDPVKYSAISYVWGSLLAPATICVNNQPSFRITTSAFAILRRLRLREGYMRVWIDAICINQANIQERNAQVAIMTQIYALSENVVAYLGPCGAQTHEEEEICRYQELHDGIAQGHAEFTSHAGYTLYPLDVPEELRWWRRVWTFPEAIAETKLFLLLGSHYIESWENRVLMWTNHRLDMPRDLFDSLLEISQVRCSSIATKSLLSLLKVTRGRYATDTRHRVYSLLPLVHARGASMTRVAVDYARPVPQVFADTMLAIILERDDLCAIFETSFPRAAGATHLPSWVPDFSAAAETTVVSPSEGDRAGWGRKVGLKSTSQEENQNLRLDFSMATLTLFGSQSRELVMVAFARLDRKPFRRRRRLNPYQESGSQWQSSFQYEIIGYESDKSEVRAQAQGKGPYTVYDRDAIEQLIDLHATLYSERPWPDNGNARTDLTQKMRENELISKQQHHGWKESSIFITQSGQLGLSALNARPGDLAVVLLGSALPVILRRTGQAGEYWLIGPAWIPDWIDGCIADDLVRGQSETHNFRIV